MNKLILILLPEIEATAKKVTSVRDQQNELRQFTVLKCYEYEDTVKRLHESNRLSGWIYTVIWNEYLRMIKNEPLDVPRDMEDIIYSDMLEELKPFLTETERTWIKAYIIDGSYVNIKRRTGIQEKYISQRIKTIIEKCKRLKSTLL